MSVEHLLNSTDGVQLKYAEKKLSQWRLSAKLTWTGPDSNENLHGKRMVTNDPRTMAQPLKYIQTVITYVSVCA